MDATAHFYSAPTGFTPFSGSRRQVGGGIFGSLARALVPKLKDFGKAAARRALSTATDVASDIAQGGNIGDVLKSRGKAFLKDSLADGVNRISGQKRPSLLVATPPPKRLREGTQRRRRKGKGLF
jgi:hypothetical protein